MGAPSVSRSLAVLLGAVVALAVSVGAATPASAHSGSYDMKFVDGQRLILVTLNTHSPAAGLRIAHNIRLYDLEGIPIAYRDVHVSVSQRGLAGRFTLRGGDVVDTTAPMRATNDSSVAMTYPQQGQYTVVTTFRAGDGSQLARGEFAVDVAKGVGGSGLPLGTILLMVVAFALGGLCAHLAARRPAGDNSAVPARLSDTMGA